jgi:flagellin FlaB
MLPKFKDRKAMTGLETAIVLIAFVITAAAFAFVVLNMGFLSAQKTQTVLSSGMKEASSSLLFDGDMVGTFDTTATPAKLNGVTFYVRLSQGQEPIDTDPTKMVVTYACLRTAGVIYNNATSGIVTWTRVSGSGTGTLIQPGQRWEVSIDFTKLSSATLSPTTTSPQPQAYESFTIELRPATGAVLSIVRNVGPVYNAVQVIQ